MSDLIFNSISVLLDSCSASMRCCFNFVLGTCDCHLVVLMGQQICCRPIIFISFPSLLSSVCVAWRNLPPQKHHITYLHYNIGYVYHLHIIAHRIKIRAVLSDPSSRHSARGPHPHPDIRRGINLMFPKFL